MGLFDCLLQSNKNTGRNKRIQAENILIKIITQTALHKQQIKSVVRHVFMMTTKRLKKRDGSLDGF